MQGWQEKGVPAFRGSEEGLVELVVRARKWVRWIGVGTLRRWDTRMALGKPARVGRDHE